MKHIKLFEQFLKEAKVPSFLSKLGKWTQLEADDYVLDGTDYTKVSSFMLETDTDLDYSGIIINIYDDKDFSIFFDSAPISLSAHSKREAISMAQTMNEHPLPLSNLNKKELDKIVNDLKSEYLDESVKVNEGSAFQELADKYKDNPYGIGANSIEYVESENPNADNRLVLRFENNRQRNQVEANLKKMGIKAEQMSKSMADKAFMYRYELTVFEFE